MSIRRFALVSLMLTPLACDKGDGGVSGPPVSDQESASQGFSALSTVLAEVGTQGPPAGRQLGSNDKFEFRASESEVNVSVDCPSGGSMSISGTFVQDGTFDANNPSAGGTLDIAFDYSMSFDNCAAQDVVIDGGLNYALDLSVDTSTNVYDYSFAFSGEVGFSGSVSGTCSIDATGSMSSETGVMTYEGTICGYDASELDL